MDKNTLVGFLLIGAVLIGFSLLSRPSKEEIAQRQRYQDSIQVVAQQEEAKKAEAEAALSSRPADNYALSVDSSSLFYQAAQGEEKYTTLENNLVKLVFTNKGGRVHSATLKEYNDQQKEPLTLFDRNEMLMNFLFFNKQETIETEDYYFQPIMRGDSTLIMRLAANDQSYIDFIYTVRPNDYIVDFTIHATNMRDKLSTSANYVEVEWSQRTRQIEKGFKFEERYSNLTYKFTGADTDYLSETKDVKESIPGRLDWVAFKNQFFSSAFIADQCFEQSELSSTPQREGSGFLKKYSTRMNTFFDPTGKEPTTMHFYFGPNKYKTLKAIDKTFIGDKELELERLVPLGWGFLRWINRWFTIPLFDWLSGWGLNMGIVLLFMTIIVKLLVFPFTYKSYLSSAKMRVLKPQINIISQKYPKQEDAMKKQQETMALYNKYGVSPMGGCLPSILQMPIFFALFMFVPTAIELRQESFLWASDLSTYDALITWGFNIPFIGNHLSLFCLLFSATNILNTMYTMKQQDTGQASVPGMKIMMYAMPIMFIFILNDYASGLNYYYFVSTLTSIITMLVLRRTVSDDKLLAKLEANKNNPKKQKKSGGLMARMEAMQKEQERLMKEKAKQNKR